MSSTINLKIDEITKKKAQEIAYKMGLSLNTVIKAYLNQFVRTQRLDVALYDIPENKEIEWEKSKQEARNSKGYKDIDKLITDSLEFWNSFYEQLQKSSKALQVWQKSVRWFKGGAFVVAWQKELAS